MTSRLNVADCECWVAEVKPYTMVPVPRLLAFVSALESIVSERVPGDIVECGVWRGGVLMLGARVLAALGDTSRHIWLYDTFKGMTEPTDVDRRFSGKPASIAWTHHRKDDHNDWCYCPVEEVRANLATTGYPAEKQHFIEGDVCETLAAHRPEGIAILRLDTDWYASTRAELEALYPRLAPGGYLLVDDYSDWQGSRKAVEEYLAPHAANISTTIVEGSLFARRMR